MTKLFQDGVVIKPEGFTGQLFGRRSGNVRSVVDGRLFPFFLQHSFWIFHPSIVKHAGARIRQPLFRSALEILLRRFQMKSDGIATGFHLAIVPNDAYSPVIEPGIRRPIVRNKMEIPKHEALDGGIPEMATHGLLYPRQIVLMHDFIGLNVEGPVACTPRERNVGLLGIDQAVLPERFIPDGFHDFDLGVPNRTESIPGCHPHSGRRSR